MAKKIKRKNSKVKNRVTGVIVSTAMIAAAGLGVYAYKPAREWVVNAWDNTVNFFTNEKDKKTIAGLEGQVKDLQARHVALEFTLAQKQLEINQKNNQIAGMETEIQGLTQSLLTANNTIQSLETEKDLIEKSLDEKQEDLDAKLSQISALEATILQKQAEIESKLQEIAQLEASGTATQEELDSAYAELLAKQTEITGLNQSLQTLEQSVSTLQTEIGKLEADKTALESQINSLSAQVVGLNQDIDNLTAERNSLQSEITVLEGEIQTAYNKISNLENQIHFLTTPEEFSASIEDTIVHIVSYPLATGYKLEIKDEDGQVTVHFSLDEQISGVQFEYDTNYEITITPFLLEDDTYLFAPAQYVQNYNIPMPPATEGLEFTLNADEESYSVAYGAATDKDVIIPAEHNGLPVTTIGLNAFFAKSLTSVVIPDSVTTIGYKSFSINSLTSVAIPDSVTTIGWNAFSSNKLTSVVIPDSVTKIDSSAFADNQLTSVVFPDSVTTIWDSAFKGNQLTSVVIPDSVTRIGYRAFLKNQLTSVVIPDSVTKIEESAFGSNKLTSVVIPESVTTIEYGAFYDNQLTSVVIPDSVTKIEEFAFEKNQLTNVYVPMSVTDLHARAFGEGVEIIRDFHMYHSGYMDIASDTSLIAVNKNQSSDEFFIQFSVNDGPLINLSIPLGTVYFDGGLRFSLLLDLDMESLVLLDFKYSYDTDILYVTDMSGIFGGFTYELTQGNLFE